MMMERRKPAAPAPEQEAKPTSSSPAEQLSLNTKSDITTNTVPAATINSSSDDRVRDLERRLDALDSVEKNTTVVAITNTKSTATIVDSADIDVSALSHASSTASSAPNPLLKRIQAAQARARLAEQKEREAKKAADEDRKRREREIEEEIVRKATETQAELERKSREKEMQEEAQRIQKAQSALRSVAERALEDKHKNNVPTHLGSDEIGDGSTLSMDASTTTTTTVTTSSNTVLPPVATTAITHSIATVGVAELPALSVSIMKSSDPPPPSLTSIEIPLGTVSDQMVGYGMNSRVLAEQQQQQDHRHEQQQQNPSRTMKPDPPPSFNIDEQQWHYTSAQSTKPIAPPPAAFYRVQHPIDPPTLVEDEGIDTITVYDERGNHLTSKERQALLDEQRKLYESIMKEKADNDAAIAKANADLFDMRSSNAVARSMGGGDSIAGSAESTVAPAGVLESSLAAEDKTPAGGTSSITRIAQSSTLSSSQQTITIGSNQTIALHGQEITRKAISDGTAILTQCVNCHNWMQVTGKATLILCPICRMVSPVVKLNQVLTKEDAIQLTKDRELAEKIQAELDHGDDGVTQDNVEASQHRSNSWWDRISSIVSYGVADEDRHRGELGVTRPPGAVTAPALSQYPGQRRGNASTPGVFASSTIRPSTEPHDEMVGHGMNSRFLSEQQRRTTVTPSAPPHAATDLLDHLHGVQPVAPPLSANVQSETQEVPSAVDDEGIDAISEFDENGNPLTLEQRRVILDEQRKLYESIMKEKADNDAAIAEAEADSSYMRSSSASSRMMSRGGTTDTSGAPGAGMLSASSVSQYEVETSQSTQRRIKIGSNQTVALRGQESTKNAIKDGTAIIVQCINCQRWMQITGSATLMLCPICQVVSPVTKQTEVLTKEDAIQLTLDRKLAEKLQAEMNDGEVARTKTEEGYFTRLFGGYTAENGEAASSHPTSSSQVAAQQQSDSWWSRISSIASHGVAEETYHRGELGVTRPPGSLVSTTTSQYPVHIHGHTTSAASNNSAVARGVSNSTHNEEAQGLLAVDVDGNEENLPPGRVAERQPMFSCVVNSVSSAAAAVFTTGNTDSEGNVHGVDGTSLLITNARRGVGDNAGEYSRLSDEDR